MPAGFETRAAGLSECRASADGMALTGYAAVFDSPAMIGGAWEEVIAPTAFDKALEAGVDVPLVVDHEPTALLARTRSGTLKLSKDAHGLRVEARLPDTQLGRDVAELVRRGDAYGMSFAFLPRKGGETWQGDRRTLTDVQLFDVSVVRTAPAYPATSVAVRKKRLASRREYELVAL